jgi:hypothetical protein
MTEADWLSATDPTPLLAFLPDTGRLSERKARLFGVACCRRVWPLLTDERSREAVELAERYADDATASAALAVAAAVAGEAAEAAHWGSLPGSVQMASGAAARAAVPDFSVHEAASVAELAAEAAGRRATDDAREAVWAVPGKTNEQRWAAHYAVHRAAEAEERAAQAALLRDLFGPLPFRAVALSPSCRSPDVVALATTLYDRRAFDRLSVLATYLEDAGCDHQGVLDHLRSPGPHVRGCWAVDVVLGKT